ncbi:substrate-binding periplasmic protein [Parachitinimonas caeni]|uniref:Transporter substrate-binding domain-containing protein n=1 Tax=Parachitinimonas caeni TaxID=3031301 RepID=A0ABT7DUX4_9NEIS|nr:transporter substrate-binding domain-containing protein [Parachitinimonas caeni]MDK2123875.1 transporter substrate-binding domain-containing protein [Parachitinimonas caeni]
MTKVLLSLALTSLALGAQADGLNLNTEDYPPFNMTDGGKVGGLSTEVVQEMAKRAGVKVSVELLPWARALDNATKNKDHCVYSAIRSAQREKLFKWIGPLAVDQPALIAKVDSKITLKSIDDAKPYKIGGYQGDAVTQSVVDRKLNVEVVPANKLNIPKLEAGRIDFWVGTEISGLYLAKREGAAGKFKVAVKFGELRDAQLWLACNPGVADDMVAKLDKALKDMESDGTAEKIRKKYM